MGILPTLRPPARLSQPPQPATRFKQGTLQQRLQALLEGSNDTWTYAIMWQQANDSPFSSLLGWGDGYYNGEEDKEDKENVGSNFSSPEQEHRRKVLNELNSLISGDSVSDESSAFDEEVNDTEWFFLVSMAQSFVNDDGLPGQAYFNSTPVWLVGNENLALSRCERARQGQEHGLQTLVCIPSVNGVLELGSTELIYQNNDFMNQVKMFFDFGSSSQVAHQGENVMGTWAT